MNIRKLKKKIPKENRDEMRSNYIRNVKYFSLKKEDIIPYNKWMLAIFTNKYNKAGTVPIKGY